MIGLLRTLAVVLLIAGIAGCVGGVQAALRDDAFYRAASALERHSADLPFLIEYYQALGQHAVYLLIAAMSGAVSVVGSTVLFALAAILSRLRQLEARVTR